jgi:hypothetical protein
MIFGSVFSFTFSFFRQIKRKEEKRKEKKLYELFWAGWAPSYIIPRPSCELCPSIF